MKKIIILFIGFNVVIFFGIGTKVEAKVPTPQIFNIVESSDNSYRPWVIGWTPNDVEVEVFMDENSQGYAKVVPNKSGTASFGWSPQKDLSLGFHEFRIRGKYANSYSDLGGILGYWVKPPVSVPTLVEPEIFEDHVLIKGLIKNNLSVKIYIDNIMFADFYVPTHPSGTTNFWFKAKGLLNGVHKVYAVAQDEDGRLSKFGNSYNFKTEQQQITKGSDDKENGAESDVVVNQVIDETVAGQVKINNINQTNEQVVVKDSVDNEAQVLVEEKERSGETSSDQEVVNQDFISSSTVDIDKFRRNRLVGLGLLGLAVVMLFGWYWREKDKPQNLDSNT
jgi:hypothetical protein